MSDAKHTSWRIVDGSPPKHDHPGIGQVTVLYIFDDKNCQIAYLENGILDKDAIWEVARFIAAAPETAQERDELRERNAGLMELLKVARCPDADCSDGVIPHQVPSDDWGAERCQWCYERDIAIANEKGKTP